MKRIFLCASLLLIFRKKIETSIAYPKLFDLLWRDTLRNFCSEFYENGISIKTSRKKFWWKVL